MKKVLLTSVALFALATPLLAPPSKSGFLGNIYNDAKSKITGGSSSKNDPSASSFLSSILSGIKNIVGPDANTQSRADSQKMSAVKAKFCKKGNFTSGDFSLRSFEGRLCRDEAVAALYLTLCPGQEGFSTSQCSKNAKNVLGDRANNPGSALKQILMSRGMDVARLICSGTSARALFASTCAGIPDPSAPLSPTVGTTGNLPQFPPIIPKTVPPVITPPVTPNETASTPPPLPPRPSAPPLPPRPTESPVVVAPSAPPPLPPRINGQVERAMAASAEATAKAKELADSATPPPLPPRPAPAPAVPENSAAAA